MKVGRLEAGRAHSEVVAPQQHWRFAQQSLAASIEAGDFSGWDGFDCAIA